MDSRAQMGTEYLLTYGWVLVLLSTIVGVLLFVFAPAPTIFSTFPQEAFSIKSAAVSGNAAEIKLLNATGEEIVVESVHFFGGLGASSSFALNNVSFPVVVSSSGELFFSGLAMDSGCGSGGTMVFFYNNPLGVKSKASVSCKGGAGLPILWFGFEEGSGIIASDSGAIENNGNLVPSYPNGPAWQASGCPSGKCLDFDGIDDSIEVADNPALKGMPYLALSAWVYARGASADVAPVIDKGELGEYQLYWVSGNIGGSLKDIMNEADTGIAFELNKWQHIAMVYDGSSCKWYKNGRLVHTDTGFSGNIASTENPVYIGGRQGKFLNAKIDEAMVFNRVLSAFEACSLCNEHAAAVSVLCDC